VRHHRVRDNLIAAAALAIAAVVFGAVRSRRTGVELGLLAVAALLFALAATGLGRRSRARTGAWLAIAAVVGVAVEPHLH